MEHFKRLKLTGRGPDVCTVPMVASLGKKIYYFGGLKDDYTAKLNTFYDTLYQLSIDTQEWKTLDTEGEHPPASAYGRSVGDPNRQVIWMYGGTTYSYSFADMKMYADLWCYNPNKNKWEKLSPNQPGPGGRSSHNLWLDGDKLYLFGGVSPDWRVHSDLWSLDLNTLNWELLVDDKHPNCPPPRFHAMSGSRPTSDGKLIIYNGEKIHPDRSFEALEDTWVFDLKSSAWKKLELTTETDLLPPRNFSGAELINDRLFVHGGAMSGVGAIPVEVTGAPFQQRGVSDEIWYLDCKDYIWKKCNPGGDPLPRLKRHTAVHADGKFYLFGGFDYQWYLKKNGPGQIWNKDVYEFNPSYL